MRLEATVVSKIFNSLRADASTPVETSGILVLIARFETDDLHEMWERIAPKFRRRDAA